MRAAVDSTAFVSQIVEAIREVVGPGPVALSLFRGRSVRLPSGSGGLP